MKTPSRSVTFTTIVGMIATLSLIACLPVTEATTTSTGSRLDQIKLPPGFKIDVFAENVNNARSLCQGTKGTIFVGTRKAGNVYAIEDKNGDFKADKIHTLATGMNMPNGVAFRDGALFVAEVNRIIRYDNIEAQLSSPPKPVVVNDDFPTDEHHGWKYIAFGPDGKLYVPVGAPCNICERLDNPQYASMMRMNPDGSNLEVFASGIRNSVGFAWHPTTKELWFTDNGRDWLGDDAPNDELNHAPKQGLHFGYPYCHAGYVLDPKLGEGKKCSDYVAPAQRLGAHVASLGMLFYTGSMFPKEYQNRIFICEHGSWNRKVPDGYRVTTVTLDGNKSTAYQPFATGWLQEKSSWGKTKNKEPWGRPVASLQLADGSLLVSDDQADMIYRISYKAN